MSKLNFISPFFIVSNLKDSVAFYVSKLGFKVLYIGPEGDEYFAMIGRGPVSIMLKAITPDIKPIPNPTRHEWAAWDAYVSTEEPDTLFEEFSSAGVIFRKPIHDNSDGLHGFEVTDADGYVLFFGRPKA
ncbi:VOC family protein [Mucilaginibacter dorajii]|uniref:VOC domain-containing protein n=1 Tax=Mucilaginibacter dorajii TaxID=692994 RepID=A0ABP7Q8H1_9SPHI|nr:VOC family protein [Mucilaginibacter dorajii]MCS3737487.1 catechol 2,3-dioxygenase-like lactoylglutathione lyase family enzyme [Mucilaginibacter dorajii]